MNAVYVKAEAVEKDDHGPDAIIAENSSATIIPRKGEGIVMGEGAYTVVSVAYDLDTDTAYVSCADIMPEIDELEELDKSWHDVWASKKASGELL